MREVLAATMLLSALVFGQTINKSQGWLESAMVEFAPVANATEYKMYYTGGGSNNVPVDPQLIRSYGSYWRGDAIGLKPGTYTLKVTAVVGGVETIGSTASVTVSAYDRSGFAFANGVVPGAYKADGTLKDDAVVLYVSQNTINTVSLSVADAGVCTGLQAIFDGYKKGKDTRPLAVRLIGQVGIPANNQSGDLVIENNNNENSFITFEGVGKDAVMDGWGLRIKNANNVEVRNVGVINVSSNEGDNIGLQQKNRYIWVHHNDLFYGNAGSAGDQVKGDGALDCKKSTFVTFDYNHFWDTGKSSLLGLSENTTEDLYVTYHHNWFDHSDSRHPRVRFYSAHVYNNYYDGIAKYGAGSTNGSSVFMEANYFRNTKYPMLISMQGSDVFDASKNANDYTNSPTFSKEDGGIIKAYNNHIEGAQRFVAYGDANFPNSTVDFDAYVVASAKTTVPTTVKSYKGENTYNNFDTDASMYAYTADSPEQAKIKVMAQAGRMEGGDLRWTFDNGVDDASYAVNVALKNAVTNYQTKLVYIQGEGTMPGQSSSSAAVSSSSAQVSSSSAAVSSSSAQVSSSSAAVSSSSAQVSSSSVALLPISAAFIHVFHEDGLSSDYLSLTGNLATNKGSIVFTDATLTQCLKLESATQVAFELAQAGEITLYFNTDFSGKVKIDGKDYSAAAGVLTLDLAAGYHVITKGDVANLYVLKIVPQSSTDLHRSAPEKALWQQGRLVLPAGATDLRIFNLHGQPVANYHSAGYYIVQFKHNGQVQRQLLLMP